jgi:hypothetical protein
MILNQKSHLTFFQLPLSLKNTKPYVNIDKHGFYQTREVPS